LRITGDVEAHPRGLTLGEATRAIRAERTRVLVAEDDPEMRNLLVQDLQADGFEVVSAMDGLDALGAIGQASSGDPIHAFDIVVADLRMPGLSGLDLLAALKRTHSSAPFILITAFASAETHETARRLGAWAVLDKPFGLELLRAAIHNAA
jgi:CheY-like chemotaxis protein